MLFVKKQELYRYEGSYMYTSYIVQFMCVLWCVTIGVLFVNTLRVFICVYRRKMQGKLDELVNAYKKISAERNNVQSQLKAFQGTLKDRGFTAEDAEVGNARNSSNGKQELVVP